MYKSKNWVTFLVIEGTLVVFAWFLMQKGLFGVTLFCSVPFITGAVGAISFKAEDSGHAASLGIQTVLAGAALFLAFRIEGLICILMALPIGIPLAAWGGMLGYKLTSRRTQTAGAMLLLMPAVGWDVFAKPPVRPVVTSVEIAASPQQVWNHVVEFPELAEPEEWYFRLGIAYPKRARIVDNVRYCEFSTGPFVEPISTWDEPHLLAFRVTQNPPPMRELTPYENVDPKHLHGYMESEHGEFRLTPLDGGRRTRLQGTTWYRHGLWPDFYWRVWSDAIIHRIHLRVLGHIKNLAENQQ